uniref:Uncharacterized protein n=1 Tax=Anguilla anguilla TaxID=7936 RepID=A0A0E9XUX9_ANGAN
MVSYIINGVIDPRKFVFTSIITVAITTLKLNNVDYLRAEWGELVRLQCCLFLVGCSYHIKCSFL